MRLATGARLHKDVNNSAGTAQSIHLGRVLLISWKRDQSLRASIEIKELHDLTVDVPPTTKYSGDKLPMLANNTLLRQITRKKDRKDRRLAYRIINS